MTNGQGDGELEGNVEGSASVDAGNHDTDVVDDIVPDELPQHLAGPRVDFMPWHKVRKEFIRQQQWNELTARMIERRIGTGLQDSEGEWSVPDCGEQSDVPPSVSVDRPLRCLVIPGDDLLDVRALHRDLASQGVWLRYLGFNESHGSDHVDTRVHISNNAVTSMERVARDSRVIADRFQSIAKPESQAYRYLKEYGPFHVVNLDFCGSLFPNSESSSGPYFDAIHQLLAYQFANQTTGWLLFVTTAIKPAKVDEAEFQKLCVPARENYLAHAEFATKVGEVIPRSIFENSAGRVDLANIDEVAMISLFGVALGKWLLKLGHSASPTWTIEMRRSFRYSISESNGAVMLSLAFEFQRNVVPPTDRAGVSSVTNPPLKVPSEASAATKLASSVGGIKDVDDILRQDVQLHTALRDAQAELLAEAGYDRDAYLRWVAAGEPTS